MEWTNEKDMKDIIKQAKEEEKNRVIKEAFQIVDYYCKDKDKLIENMRKCKDMEEVKNWIEYELAGLFDQMCYDLGNVK